jgi:formylglycine-generating enzyme required for sulfatase activity
MSHKLLKFQMLSKIIILHVCCNTVFAGAVTGDSTGRTPIIHADKFRHEQELFNYTPEFYPNVVSFDKQNRPYLRSRGKSPYLQTIDITGKWHNIDFCGAIKQQYPAWDGRIATGPSAEEKVATDNADNIYLLADLRRSNLRGTFLLTSTNHGKNWRLLKLPGRSLLYLFEAPDGNNDKSHPPAILGLGRRQKTLRLLLPEWTSNGKLIIQHNVVISNHSLLGAQHSGGGNACFTKGDKVYVVWPESIPVSGHDGTPQYIAVYDRRSRKLSSPAYLGSNGHGKPDPHNLPAVTMDSKGYLHCLLGSHHDPFRYTRSLRPMAIDSGWTKPIAIGVPKRKIAEGSYTYAALNCDRFDNLHVSARWAGGGYINRLVYMRKKCGGDWEPHKILVQPFRNSYSVFYHKQSLDRRGRIFINYATFANHMVKKDAEDYNRKWPGDKLLLPDDLDQYVNGYNFSRNPDGSRPKIKPTWHDPAILVSGDGGDTWRLGVTPDFMLRRGICKDKKTFTNSIGMPLRKILPGHFLMGDIEGDADERPLYPVSISRPFYIGQYEVRVKDFKKFTAETGYTTELEQTPAKTQYAWLDNGFKLMKNGSWRKPGYKQNDNYPVTMLTPGDMLAFCAWLSKKENCRYRLPTEAEWEYACRAGTATKYSFGEKSAQLPQYAWYRKNSQNHPHEVGKLSSNPWGLYDMHGNLSELCNDYYGAYSDLPKINPTGNTSAISGRCLRGGSWLDDKHGNGNGFNLRSAARYYMVFPRVQTNWMGFRIVKEVKK